MRPYPLIALPPGVSFGHPIGRNTFNFSGPSAIAAHWRWFESTKNQRLRSRRSHWVQDLSDPACVDFGQPVVDGFVNQVVRNPLRPLLVFLAKLDDRIVRPKYLVQTFDVWRDLPDSVV